MQLVCNLFFLNHFLLGYTKNACNQRGFSKRYLHNSKRTKANADNEAIHNAHRNGWLGEHMGCMKINLFDALDKYEYWKGKRVKSVLGEFSSGVSISRNKSTRSDSGAPFLPGAPPAGGYGGLPLALLGPNH